MTPSGLDALLVTAVCLTGMITLLGLGCVVAREVSRLLVRVRGACARWRWRSRR